MHMYYVAIQQDIKRNTMVKIYTKKKKQKKKKKIIIDVSINEKCNGISILNAKAIILKFEDMKSDNATYHTTKEFQRYFNKCKTH